MNEVDQLRALLELFGATGACAQALRDMADELEKPEPEPAPAPASEPWRPTPGQWAQINPEEVPGTPDGVDRVLVTQLVDILGSPHARVAWADARTSGDDATWGNLPADYLAPVQPRVWGRAEDVPLHVAVRDSDGAAYSGLNARRMGDEYGPFTEVLPEDGAL